MRQHSTDCPGSLEVMGGFSRFYHRNSVTIKRTIINFLIFKLKNHNKFWLNFHKSLINLGVKKSKQTESVKTENQKIEKIKNIL